jgi:hypothetical protein
MSTLNARKNPIPFGDADVYYNFIISIILNSSVKQYHSVISWKNIDTADGQMLLFDLSDDINDPTADVIAECIINMRHYYVYKDSVYALAHIEGMFAITFVNNDDTRSDSRPKSVIVYKIGDLLR